jgi:mono/diheme cytochrome c family protein
VKRVLITALLSVAWAPLTLTLAPARAAAQTPHVNYMVECQGCHLPDGRGKPGAVPRLDGHVARFLSVPGGRAYLVQVPGSALSPLSDEALAGVLNWIVTTFGPAEIARAHPAYDATEIARLRKSPLVDVEETRRALIERIEGSHEDERPE